MKDKMPKEPLDRANNEKELMNGRGFMEDLPEDFVSVPEEALEELHIPQAAPPGVEHMKPRLQAFLALTRTKLDVEAVRHVAKKVSSKMENLLQNGLSSQSFRQAPGILKPLKQMTSYRNASPCGINWADMSGDDKLRFCQRCRRRVYDFTEMDDEEGQAVVRRMEEKTEPKIALYRRNDGMFLHGDCPVGQRKKLLLIVPAGLGCLSLLAVVVLVWLLPPKLAVSLPLKSASTVADKDKANSVQAAINSDLGAAKPEIKPDNGIGRFHRNAHLLELAVASRKIKVEHPVYGHDPEQLAKNAASRSKNVVGVFRHEHPRKTNTHAGF